MRKIVDLGITILTGYLLLVFFRSGINPNDNPVFFGISSLLIIGGFAIIRYLIEYTGKNLRKRSNSGNIQFLGIEIAANFFLSILIISICTLAFIGIRFQFNFLILSSEEFQHSALRFVIIWLIVILIYSIISYFFLHLNSFENLKLESEKLNREKVQLQLEALKSQLKPHYLFNSLNTISSLFTEDIESAEKYIREFAKSNEYLHKINDRFLVSLNEELIFLQSFIFLQQIKYGANLQFDINVAENERKSSIPPLSLQILIENIFKHNIISSKHKLNIKIYSLKNYLVVENNIHKKDHEDSIGIGLNNIKNRYSFLTNLPVEISENESFKVKIPLIKPNE